MIVLTPFCRMQISRCKHEVPIIVTISSYTELDLTLPILGGRVQLAIFLSITGVPGCTMLPSSPVLWHPPVLAFWMRFSTQAFKNSACCLIWDYSRMCWETRSSRFHTNMGPALDSSKAISWAGGLESHRISKHHECAGGGWPLR